MGLPTFNKCKVRARQIPNLAGQVSPQISISMASYEHELNSMHKRTHGLDTHVFTQISLRNHRWEKSSILRCIFYQLRSAGNEKLAILYEHSNRNMCKRCDQWKKKKNNLKEIFSKSLYISPTQRCTICWQCHELWYLDNWKMTSYPYHIRYIYIIN